MKPGFLLLLIFMLFPACSLFNLFDNDSDGFPECAGTTASFSPALLRDAYVGAIWNQDTTLNTPFIFTDFEFDHYYLRRSWNMHFRIQIGATTTYHSSFCSRSWETGRWFADTAFVFRGHYSRWYFAFDHFDCSSLSGTCTVIQPDLADTLHFQFEGSR